MKPKKVMTDETRKILATARRMRRKQKPLLEPATPPTMKPWKKGEVSRWKENPTAREQFEYDGDTYPERIKGPPRAAADATRVARKPAAKPKTPSVAARAGAHLRTAFAAGQRETAARDSARNDSIDRLRGKR